jgi:hypothetical protein
MNGNYHFKTWVKDGVEVEFESDEDMPVFSVGQFYPGAIDGITADQTERIRERAAAGYCAVFVFEPKELMVRLL